MSLQASQTISFTHSRLLFRLSSLLPIIVLALAWEAVCQLGLVRSLFLPAPSVILDEAWSMIVQGRLFKPLYVSLWRALAGLLLAAAVGIPLGLLMARVRAVGRLLDPLISFGFPIPKISLIPLFVLWFGVWDLSKILLVFVSCIFPLVVNTAQGARSVTRQWIWSAQSMGMTSQMIFGRIILPATLPYIFRGLRVATPLSLIVVFTAEMVAGGSGLGSSLMLSHRFFETPTVYAIIIYMLSIGILFDKLLLLLHSRFLAWSEDNEHV